MKPATGMVLATLQLGLALATLVSMEPCATELALARLLSSAMMAPQVSPPSPPNRF